MDEPSGQLKVQEVEFPLDRERFMRSVISELASVLEEVVGLNEASGFVAAVGQRLGEEIQASYLQALQIDQLGVDQVRDVLVDLKRRISGDFFVKDGAPKTVRLGCRACPFGDKVSGRESLCMMTSNVFGTIAADNLGYAKVELKRTIARGDAECDIVVHLDPDASASLTGREYFGGD